MKPIRMSSGLAVCSSVVLLALLCCAELRTGSRSMLAQLQPASSSYFPEAKQKHFRDYQKDFLDFEKSAQNSTVELAVANDLQTAARETQTSIDTASLLIQIYENLSCSEDRTRTKLVLYTQFAAYSKELDLAVSQTNYKISFIQRPGVAAEATRMRDELREVKSILDSIKLQ
jgi:hypothetical protein